VHFAAPLESYLAIHADVTLLMWARSGGRQGNPPAAQKFVTVFEPIVADVKASAETFIEHMYLSCVDPVNFQHIKKSTITFEFDVARVGAALPPRG
jgi:hypothetical protein